MANHNIGFEPLLTDWFGADPWASDYTPQNKRWFGGSVQVDEELRSRYLPLHEQAAQGLLAHWKETPRGALALILLLDQFSRNMFRGTARMFRTDADAQAIALSLVREGGHKKLAPPERAFVYMCLEHSEEVPHVELAVKLFEELASSSRPRRFYKNQLRIARNHLATLKHFGRYPHRNELLNRESTHPEQQHVLASKRRFEQSVRSNTGSPPLRILVLHSFRQSGARLRSRTPTLRNGLAHMAEFVYAEAPLPYRATGTFLTELEEDFGDDMPNFAHQRCWWNATPDHATYHGWHHSLADLNHVFETEGPFDGILGFAQGAAVVGILSGLQASGKLHSQAPAIHFDFAISISGFRSRDEQHQSLFQPQSIDLPSFHCWSLGDVLIDNNRSFALAEAFVEPEIVTFEGGHFIPKQWPIDEIAKFLRKQTKPILATSPWERRVNASRVLGSPSGLSDSAADWATVEWPSGIADWLTRLGGNTDAVDDVLLVAWSKQRNFSYKNVHDITSVIEGDEFYEGWFACYRQQPSHTLSRLSDVAQHGGFALLNRMALLAHYVEDAPQLQPLVTAIEQIFVQQLREDLAKHSAGERVSNCALAAPRLRSATDRRTKLAKRVALQLHPHGGREQWAGKLDYRRTLRRLKSAIRSSQATHQRKTLRHANPLWTPERLAAPVSSAVTDPKPEPVIPCEATELEHLLVHLRSKKPVAQMKAFPRGTHMPDGRLDLCKQVVGPAGIGPLLDSMEGNPTVSHLLIGNNLVGAVGAKRIATFIAEKRSKLKVWYIAGNRFDASSIAQVCAAIAEDPIVEGLWLKRNPLKPAGATPIAQLLRSHPNLRTLDLTNTGLLDEGTATIIGALDDATPLEHLYLNTNGISPTSAHQIADYLENRCKLSSLFLGCNRLGDEGTAAIATALMKNQSLKRLDLASNRIGPEGAKALFFALREQENLQYLNLGWTRATAAVGELGNQIGNRGCEALAELLCSNTSLMGLDISHNQISQSKINDISDALDVNQTLVELRLPQYGKAINHDTLAQLDEKLQRNQQRWLDRGLDPAMLATIATPKPTQEILSVYRTA